MNSVPSTPGRRSRTPSADIERELIAAAEVVLLRDGPGGITVRAVAAQAGVAPMGVYSRLGGKEGLVNALLVRGFDLLRAALARSGKPADPLDRLRVSGQRYRRFALDNRSYYAIMFEGVVPHDFNAPEVAEHGEAAFGELVRDVELAAAAGVIAAPDSREVAQQIWSCVHGAVTLELQGLVLTPDPEATYRGAVDTVLRGLALRRTAPDEPEPRRYS